MGGADRLEMKELVMRLAEAINHTIAESEEVRHVIDAIHDEGFGVEVSLAACIGLFRPQAGPDKTDAVHVKSEMKFELDEMDLDFLKSLRLRIE